MAHNIIRDIILPQQNRHSLLQEVPDQDIEGFNPRNKSFILNGISFVRGSLVSALFCTCVQYCSTDLLYMCSTKKNRTTGTGRGTHHGHCKGNSFTGTLRTKALRARICCTKQVAPGPCIARAPDLVHTHAKKMIKYQHTFAFEAREKREALGFLKHLLQE